jgi:Ca2+-binding EF-hand superfamily protein
MPSPLNKTLSILVFAATAVFATGCNGDGEDEANDDALETAEALSAESTGSDPVEDAVLSDGDVDDASEEAAGAATDGAEPRDLGCGIRRALRLRIKDRFDANGDGKLDEDERAELESALGDHAKLKERLFEIGVHARHHVWKRLVWVYDVDGDGSLDREERKDLHAAVKARCEARKQHILERFDADGDGALDDGEMRAAIKAHVETRRERLRDTLQKVDADGDHRVEDVERAAARAALKANYLEKRAAMKEKFDANDDGKLDDAEIAALKEAIRARFERDVSAE